MSGAIKAVLVDDVDADRSAGAFELVREGRRVRGMIYICPCGCGSDGFLPFRPAPSPSWEWDGNAAAPTLSPSIHRITKRTGEEATTHWHGWLRAGEWVSC